MDLGCNYRPLSVAGLELQFQISPQATMSCSSKLLPVVCLGYLMKSTSGKLINDNTKSGFMTNIVLSN